MVEAGAAGQAGAVVPAMPPRRGASTSLRRGPFRRLSAGHLVTMAAGLLGATLTLAALRSADHRVEVAVAATDLRPGRAVTADSFRFTRVRMDDGVLDRMVRPEDVAALEGSVLRSFVDEGEPVSRGDLLAPTGGGGRALGLPVEAERAVGGELTAGDRIDVLATDPDAPGLVVADLPVLEVKRPSTGALGGTERELSVIVGVDEAQALALAAVLGGDDFVLVRATGAPPAGGAGDG